jgi:hypothetical protein
VTRRALPVFAAAVVGACTHQPPRTDPSDLWKWANVGQACTSSSPAYPLPDALRDTSSHPFRDGTDNTWEDKAKLTEDIPGGFGGIGHRETHPRTTIYLLDTTKLSAAVPALVSAGLLPAAPIVAAVPGGFTYSQLYDWFRYIETHIIGVRVTMETLDDRRNRILYGLEDEASRVELERKLAEMHAPCFLVALRVTGPIRGLHGARP